MNLLHVHSGNLFGGVETMLLALKRAEPKHLHQSFALCWEGRLSDELRELGASVSLLPEVQIRSPRKVWRARRALRSLLRTSRPDVIMFHSGWSQLVFAPTATQAQIPFARYIHGLPSRFDWLDRLAMRWEPSVLITASAFTGAAAASVYPRSRRTVVHYPVTVAPLARDGQARTEVRSTLGASDDDVVVLQVSRMEPWKGQMLHLEALSRIGLDLPWQAWFAGGVQRSAEREFADALAVRARALGIEHRVRFLGERTDVSSLLSGADIFCQPNEGPEPFGIVFVEALAAGLPVVTTNLGGGAEILGRNHGRVVERSPTAVAAALRELVQSPAARQDAARGSVERARFLCDPETQAGQLVEELEVLVRL